MLIGALGWRWKKSQISVSLMLVIGVMSAAHCASAVTFDHSVCDAPDHCIVLTSDAGLDRDVYQQGDTMTLSFVIYDSRCTDGAFVGSTVSFKVFNHTVSDSTDSDNDGTAELGDGMQGSPLSMQTVVPANQALRMYAAKVCAKMHYGGDA